MLQSTLSDILFRYSKNPALWECPIQWGVPHILLAVRDVLLWVGAGAFLVGITLAVFFYLTAYGSEERARRGQDTLKWTLIGSVVIMLSQLTIGWLGDFLLAPGQISELPPPNCQRQVEQQLERSRGLLRQQGVEPGAAVAPPADNQPLPLE